MHRIRSIGVFSLVKFLGVGGMLVGLLVGVIYGGLVMLLGVGAGASGEEGSEALAIAGVGGGLFVMVAAPIFYGISCAIAGFIYGLILNLTLHLCGGLEVEIEATRKG